MSNSKKVRSKRRFRKARVRKGRHVLTVDIETRSAVEVGTRVHREIERVLMCGDAHVGISEAIAHALHGYAEHYPADVVVVFGGDLLQHTNRVNHNSKRPVDSVSGRHYTQRTRHTREGRPMTDTPAKKRPARRVLATALDTNEKVRTLLVARIAREINRADIPVAVLHQVAQCLEMWRS